MALTKLLHVLSAPAALFMCSHMTDWVSSPLSRHSPYRALLLLHHLVPLIAQLVATFPGYLDTASGPKWKEPGTFMALKLNLSVFYFMDRNLGFLIWSNALSP